MQKSLIGCAEIHRQLTSTVKKSILAVEMIDINILIYEFARTIR